MSEYSMEYPAVLRLPLRTFWSLNRQIDRIRAEREQRLLRLYSAAQEPKAAEKLAESLEGQIGKPVIFEKKFDSGKFEELAKRFSQKGRVVTETQTE